LLKHYAIIIVFIQMKKLILLTTIITACYAASAQDTIKQQRFNLHFQQTIITQNKPGFGAKYTGDNSLQTGEETQTSLTTTFYGGARLWKGAQVYFNPEMSGGAGLSKTLGVAGFPNGETFRVGGDAPKIYIARLYYTQNFEWGKDKDTLTDDANQLGGTLSKRHFSFTIGKFGMADYFDNNSFSHDPRTQFMNWSLMSNGAWDYPANTVATCWPVHRICPAHLDFALRLYHGYYRGQWRNLGRAYRQSQQPNAGV
jgi:high affinity Mn2+ porin